MKKLTQTLIGTALLTTSLFSNENLSKEQLKEFEKLDIFKEAKVSITKGMDADSVYILNVKKSRSIDTIFLTKDKKYLIAGAVINTKTGMPLTMPVDMSILEGKEAFTFGTGKDEYVLFTDPQCPYCRKFESYLPQIKDKVKIKVYYFPLDFHKEAYDLALYTMSKKTLKEKIDTMLNIDAQDKGFKNRKYSKEEKKQLEEKLNTQKELGLQLGVQGTPATFDTKGNKISWVNILTKYGVKLK